jgi:hypothetical protein
MIKLKDTAITQLDIAEYLQESSHFAFEMIILRKLKQLGFKCEHSGTYQDPVTGKTKRFDVRARKEWGRMTLWLSIQCTTPRDNFPLVIHAMPRSRAEAFHQVLIGNAVGVPPNLDHMTERPAPGSQSRGLILKSTSTPYAATNQVGKSVDLVGRDINGRIRAESEEAFDAVTETIHSCYDLVSRAHHDKSPDKIHSIVPVLVIPDGRGWQVDYDTEGNIEGGAHTTGHCPFFVGRKFRLPAVTGTQAGFSFTLSHLELVTVSAFESFLAKYASPDEYPPGYLPFNENFPRV